MAKTTVEIYLKEKVGEYLRSIEIFEGKHMKDREEFRMLQQKTQMFKRDNPSATHEDIKEDLIRIQEVHYWSFLLEQNMKNELIRAKELLILSDILGIDLELEGDDAEASAALRKQEVDIFRVDDKGEVVLVENEFKPQLVGALNERKADPDNLKTMYANIPVQEGA